MAPPSPTSPAGSRGCAPSGSATATPSTRGAIDGTEQADAPFFSPDGTWIAYFVDGKLFKVSVRGGPPALITDSANVNLPSGFWRSDGSIVFLGDAFDIRSISTSGQAGAIQLVKPPACHRVGLPVRASGEGCDARHVLHQQLRQHDAVCARREERKAGRARPECGQGMVCPVRETDLRAPGWWRVRAAVRPDAPSR